MRHSTLHHFRRRPGESGLTLIELLLVIAILGVTAGLTSMIVLAVRPRINLDLAQRTYAATLARARKHAMAKGNNVYVDFISKNLDNGRRRFYYRIIDDDGFNGSGSLAERAVFDDEREDVFDLEAANNGAVDYPQFEVIYSGVIPTGIALDSTSSAVNPLDVRVTFNPLGEAVDTSDEAIVFKNIYFNDSREVNDPSNRNFVRQVFVYSSGAVVTVRPQTRTNS